MAETNAAHNRKITKQLIAILAGPVFGFSVTIEIRTLLLQLRPAPSFESARWLTTMTSGGPYLAPLGVPVGPAQRIEQAMAPAWEAAYLVAAAGRLTKAEIAAVDGGADLLETAKRREANYFLTHLAAEERRMRAAALQDMAAKLNVDRDVESTEGLLGWRSVLDDRTTPECRAAHGRNYKADRMPAIGWPGAVHMRCRCSPGPAIPGAPILPTV